MQRTSKPILHHLLCQIGSLKQVLRIMAGGISSGTLTMVPNKLACKLILESLKNVETMHIRGLWISACVLHPGLCSFSFLLSSVNVDEWIQNGYEMIRRMLETYSSSHSTSVSSTDFNSATITSFRNNFSLKSAMSFLDDKSKSSDELRPYISETLSKSMISKLQDEDGILDFWETRWKEYPTFSMIVLRVFSTQAASSESE